MSARQKVTDDAKQQQKAASRKKLEEFKKTKEEKRKEETGDARFSRTLFTLSVSQETDLEIGGKSAWHSEGPRNWTGDAQHVEETQSECTQYTRRAAEKLFEDSDEEDITAKRSG